MINKAILLGRIGKKDMRQTKYGVNLCTLSIATSRRYLDPQGQRQDVTTWHNVNFFHKLADVCGKYANVGDMVYIEGEISNKKLEENGLTRFVHSITGNELRVIPNSSKPKDDYKDDNIGNVATSNDEDLPF